MVSVKFCGLTRAADARMAAQLGAAYAGVVFAGGPRRVEPPAAAAILGEVGASTLRVGVFGPHSPEDIAHTCEAAGLDVVQLHADPSPDAVHSTRTATGAKVWAVVRLDGTRLPPFVDELFDAADAVLLDARAGSGAALGGTGVQLPWTDLAPLVDGLRRGRTLVLAGGLRPDNVAAAVRALEPDVVDVSSGVESVPGVKDHELMRRFAAEARSQVRL